jgi:hypothetical protein
MRIIRGGQNNSGRSVYRNSKVIDHFTQTTIKER